MISITNNPTRKNYSWSITVSGQLVDRGESPTMAMALKTVKAVNASRIATIEQLRKWGKS